MNATKKLPKKVSYIFGSTEYKRKKKMKEKINKKKERKQRSKRTLVFKIVLCCFRLVSEKNMN